MKIALVHDYIKEFGGAERVLRVLADMYPEAPIYTAFLKRNSVAYEKFKDKEINESFLGPILKIWKLYSPLRFLSPMIWRSMDLSDYDVVITSASWYITRGFKTSENTKVICYCHTPPRYLYGYQTSINWQKYGVVRLYASIVNYFLRIFDWNSAQEVDQWVVNSKNVKKRVKKFYRQDSQVIYPPVEVKRFIKAAEKVEKENYFLIVSRLVGGKGLEEAVEAATELGFNLKIVGSQAGFSKVAESIKRQAGEKVEFLGRVEDDELTDLYARAKGFIALAKEEDFGITPVESMAAGTPVIAYKGGGFKETVIDDETGVFVTDTSVESLKAAVSKINGNDWDKKALQKQAKKFGRERFEKKVREEVGKMMS